MLVTVPSKKRQADRLFQAAGVDVTWNTAPTPEAIHQADTERLLSSEALTREPVAAEAPLVERLVSERTPEQLAAALVFLWNRSLPQAVDVRSIAPGAPTKGRTADTRREREPREPRQGRREQAMGGSWFKLSVGRTEKADPKWLVPVICRLGGVTKKDIGAIRIAQDYTLVEIAPDMATRFADCAAAADADEIRIEPAKAPAANEAPSPRGRAPGSRTARPPRRDRGGERGPSSRKRK